MEEIEKYFTIIQNYLNLIKNKEEIYYKRIIKNLNDLIAYEGLIDISSQEDLLQIKNEIEEFFINLVFKDYERSKKNVLELHCGAGGNDAEQWTEMLFNSYRNFFIKQNIKYIIQDISKGTCGIKSITVIYNNFSTYQLLGEVGVHRLVRKSPFNAAGKRHTSFCSVNIYPFVNIDNLEVNIDPKEIKIDTFRAGGAGGQHVNKTDSAVRITHIPTGIVVKCQCERSQHINKETALSLLRSKLLQHKKQEELSKNPVNKIDNIAWGQHFRSYVLDPYRVIKDKRIGVTENNPDRFFSGDIEKFQKTYFFHRIENYQIV